MGLGVQVVPVQQLPMTAYAMRGRDVSLYQSMVGSERILGVVERVGTLPVLCKAASLCE